MILYDSVKHNGYPVGKYKQTRFSLLRSEKITYVLEKVPVKCKKSWQSDLKLTGKPHIYGAMKIFLLHGKES